MTDTDQPTRVDDLSGRLLLASDEGLVAGLVAAFEQVLDYAAQMAEVVVEDPVTAVHEYRKSLRRARSVLRMLRKGVPKPLGKSLNGHLRALARETSLLRDAEVLAETCELLNLTGAAGRGLSRTRERVLAHREELRGAGRARAILQRGAAELPALARRLRREVVVDVPPGAIADAFARTFERELAARQRALSERTDEATHDWRKRAKEVRYQLELLAEPAGGPVEGLRQVYASLAKRLGEITDVIALRHYLTRHIQDLPADEQAALDAELVAYIAAERARAADPLVEVRERILAFGHSP